MLIVRVRRQSPCAKNAYA